MMESGFEQGKSDNLPKIDGIMMAAYFAKNVDFLSAEIRNVKASRSCRDSYGDNAIGYVQVKRVSALCTVKARITPEHKVRSKAYSVVLTCNEEEEIILSCICEDCPASQGGCKHAVCFLSWVHRRSEDPSTTSVQCYWKRSKMAAIGTTKKLIKAMDMCALPKGPLPESEGTFVQTFIEKTIKLEGSSNTQLMKYNIKLNDFEKISVHNMICEFYSTMRGSSAVEFTEFCKMMMSEDVCSRVAQMTIGQSNCALWHNIRYGRITASKVHEASRCGTMEGSLVESILGAKLIDTEFLKRGRLLEDAVIKEVEKILDIKLYKCGLLLSNQHPTFGASPDAINADYVVEIKCPSSEKALKRYLDQNSQPTNKYMAQLQLQMHFAKRTKGLFCVASPYFENTKNVTISLISYDENHCKTLIDKAYIFWCEAIFNNILQPMYSSLYSDIAPAVADS